MECLANDKKIIETYPEDEKICRFYRRYLEKEYNIKFAPDEVANRFSIEAYGRVSLKGANRYSGQFGFHGFNIDYTYCDLPHKPQKTLFHIATPPVDTSKKIQEFKKKHDPFYSW